MPIVCCTPFGMQTTFPSGRQSMLRIKSVRGAEFSGFG